MSDCECDFCGKAAKFDARTDFGSWGYVCINCFMLKCSDAYREYMKSKKADKKTGWYSTLE
jgi:hypothetical protein